MQVDLDAKGCLITVLSGPPVPVIVDEQTVGVTTAQPLRIPRSPAATVVSPPEEQGEGDAAGSTDAE